MEDLTKPTAGSKPQDYSPTMNSPSAERGKTGWGVEDIPFPDGVAYIQARWDLCIGCGACEIACSMFHYGVINRELSRIRIYRYQTPLPKSVQNVCVQCSSEERECEKACPLTPPAIYYDAELSHMRVDIDRCLGAECSQCKEACSADIPSFYPPSHNYSIVCDLCEKKGKRRPQCVEICPSYALEFLKPRFPQHLERIHPDEKAEWLSKRLYPLAKDTIQKPLKDIWES